MSNTETRPQDDLKFGWRKVKINAASERTAISGSPKLLLQLVVVDGADSGRVIYGHIPIGDSPIADCFKLNLKLALGLPDTAALPSTCELVNREIRVRISPWQDSNGQIRESVSAIEATATAHSEDQSI